MSIDFSKFQATDNGELLREIKKHILNDGYIVEVGDTVREGINHVYVYLASAQPPKKVDGGDKKAVSKKHDEMMDSLRESIERSLDEDDEKIGIPVVKDKDRLTVPDEKSVVEDNLTGDKRSERSSRGSERRDADLDIPIMDDESKETKDRPGRISSLDPVDMDSFHMPALERPEPKGINTTIVQPQTYDEDDKEYLQNEPIGARVMSVSTPNQDSDTESVTEPVTGQFRPDRSLTTINEGDEDKTDAPQEEVKEPLSGQFGYQPPTTINEVDPRKFSTISEGIVKTGPGVWHSELAGKLKDLLIDIKEEDPQNEEVFYEIIRLLLDGNLENVEEDESWRMIAQRLDEILQEYEPNVEDEDEKQKYEDQMYDLLAVMLEQYEIDKRNKLARDSLRERHERASQEPLKLPKTMTDRRSRSRVSPELFETTRNLGIDTSNIVAETPQEKNPEKSRDKSPVREPSPNKDPSPDRGRGNYDGKPDDQNSPPRIQ